MTATPQPSPTAPPRGGPVSREEFDELRSRMVRIESKLTRLLNHHGLNAQGQPIEHDPEAYVAKGVEHR